MQVRQPNFDFSNTKAHWATVPEFAQLVNAGSTPIPFTERFLNRVIARAASKLKGDDDETRRLREDIRVFIRQEAAHYRNHEKFNAVATNAGYDLSPFVAFCESEYERLWNTKSFEFCLAYCEGFETLGPPFAFVWMDEIEDLLVGADAQVVALWKWHLMEEFEHRTVCFDVLETLHGGYFLRIYGLLYQMWHLGRMTRKVRQYLEAQDRAAMSKRQRRESIRRSKQVQRRFNKIIRRHVLSALSPWYSPRRLREPVSFTSYRTALDAKLAADSAVSE